MKLVVLTNKLVHLLKKGVNEVSSPDGGKCNKFVVMSTSRMPTYVVPPPIEKGGKMSGVYARNREETQLQFYVNALELQKEITVYCMKEKKIPKKWRYAIGYPLISKVDELVDNITYANSIYPQDETELKTRKHYQTLAICNCFQVQNKLVRMERCVQTVDIKDLEKIVKLLAHEVTLLKSWKKASKIVK